MFDFCVFGFIVQIKSSCFLSDIDFSFIQQGVCAPVAFDARVGYLEILGDKDDPQAKDNDDIISERDQQLFQVF